MRFGVTTKEFRTCAVGLLLQLHSIFLVAQNPYIPFRHFSNDDGLSQNHVTSILQDRQGFMWFATAEGLNRFDGYEFSIYRHVDDDSTSIPHDNINELFMDRKGDIWLGSVNGLTRYNRHSNTFTSFIPNPKNRNAVSWSRVNRIIEDKHGNFWIAFLTGMVDYFDRNKNTFTHFAISSDTIGNGIYGEATALLLDKNENLWIGTFQGITILNSRHEVIKKFVHDPENPFSVSSNIVHDIIQHSNGSIWVSTDAGINRYDDHSDRFVRFTHDDENENSLSKNVVRKMLEDREGRLWLATENGGLDILDLKTNLFHHFKVDKASKISISDNSIYSIYRDPLDNMWVGTNAQGVNFYDRHANPFIIYQSSPGVTTNLNADKVNGIDEQPGKGFWIATEGGGLNFLDPKTNLFKAYQNNKHDPSSTPSDFVGDILWDSARQCVWVTTWGGGLWRFNPETGRGKTYKHKIGDPHSLAGNDLWRLYLSDGVLYVGTIGGGLSIYNDKTDSFSNYSTQNGLAEKNVVSFHKDKRGFLWIGGWERGVSRMDLTKKEFVDVPQSINMTATYFITGDSLGRVWFATNDGILVYDEGKDKVTTYTMADGLPGRVVHAMLDDGKGNYWISTNAGIVKFNVAKKNFHVFTMEDGLPANQFSSWPLRAKDGKMFFTGPKGVVAFHPDSIKINPIIPKVYLTDLKIFNRSVPIGGKENILTKPISETTAIELPYDYNVFSLSFVALNYTSSGRNEYIHQLEGFDKDWVHAQSNRTATYTSLEPGAYTFRVRASNNDGLWNNEGATLLIRVLPPWWRTWWFRSLMAAAFMMSVILVIILRTRRIKRINQILEATVEQKTRELKQTNQELLKREEEIAAKNRMLSEQSDELAAQNEELTQKQEEISSQRDQLSHQNENLEVEVGKRTKELLEYNHQLEQFAFISAHNLRAPVARILGLGQLLEMSGQVALEKEGIYPKLIQTTKELDNVVKDLNTILELKRNSDSYITIIDLETEVKSVLKSLEREITVSHAKIFTDFKQADKLQTVKPYLDSILYNLISNAIKYRHPNRDPIIQISTARTQSEICLSVADNGLGIDLAQHREKLFNLYSRFHLHIDGKGMGLYLVKTQMTSLGGRIEIESEEDKGSVFKAYFRPS